ncbi:MAG: pyridoxal-phosphate dependent enzyme [Minisyncoccota bacterium]
MLRSREQVYQDPIFRAMNPRGKRFMEAQFLPVSLNPFAKDGIAIAALTLKGLPHIKTVPTFQMMLEDFEQGLYRDKHTIVVDSSGNTAHAVARLAHAFGFEDVNVVLATDVPESKKGILAALSSVEIIEVGKGRSVAARAIEEARKPGYYHLNQYGHKGNVHAHELYTGPEIARALGNNVGIVAIAIGSAGTVTGVGRFLKEEYPEAIVLGVRPLPGEAVPGARNRKKMEEVVTFPWEEVVDAVIEVPRKASFLKMRELWSAVEPQPGPTSGLACKGLLMYLETLTEEELEVFRGRSAAFVCPDDGRFYSGVTIAELDTGQGVNL